MSSARLVAFSDGVIAILITIMVLELRTPEAPSWAAVRPLLPLFLGYVLSYAFLGVYWANHHHMLSCVERVDGRILWANLHLLFWLSLVPWTTAWLGEFAAARAPTAAYGLVLLGAAVAYRLLQSAIIAHQGPGSVLAAAIGDDQKGSASMLLYALAIATAAALPWLSIGLYIAVAAMWLVPDRRIERLAGVPAPGDP